MIRFQINNLARVAVLFSVSHELVTRILWVMQ